MVIKETVINGNKLEANVSNQVVFCNKQRNKT